MIAVHSADQTGALMQPLQDMNGGLSDMVARLRHGAGTIALALRQITPANADLPFRTEPQASLLQQTAASMEALTETVRRNAENARQTDQLVIAAFALFHAKSSTSSEPSTASHLKLIFWR